MPVKLDQFKKAFARKVTEDQYKGRRAKAIAIIRETEEFVKSLGATDRAREHAMSLARIYVQIDDADKLAVKSRDKAYEALNTARDSARTLCGQALDDAKKELAQHRKKADKAFDILSKSPHKKNLSAAIDKAKGEIQVVQRLGDAKRFGEAIKLADNIAAECTTARVKEELRKGEAPKKSDFEALAKMPGMKGKNRLDELVSELPDKTAAKAFKLAFEVRFGQRVDTFKDSKGKDENVKWNWDSAKKEWVAQITDPKEWERTDDRKPNKSLKKMYELFTKVPESHVNAAQNPSLNRIVHFQKDEQGAAYNGAKKSIYMYISRDEGTGNKDQSAELASGRTSNRVDMFPEPPKRDPRCLPINTEIKTPYFNWATLHEVGHAVDEKSGFMANNREKSEFGGWKVHGGKSKDFAAIAAKAFKCDAKYIEKMLNKEKVADKDVPAELKKDDAARKLRQKVDLWCADVISGNVWWDGAKSKRIADAIGDGRVYQMAYDWEWNSYELKARAQGIHGYQFRAQYEWFAELYAAYYSEKLKDAHPFVPELKKLEKPS